MNKLISINPILRFKLGRKIIKADFGTVLEALGHSLGLHTPETKNGIIRVPQITGDYVYTKEGRYGRMATPEEIEKTWGKSKRTNPSDRVLSKLNDVTETVDDNGNLIRKPSSVPRKKGRKLIEKDGTEYWLGSDGSKTLLKKGTSGIITNLKNNLINWETEYNTFKNGLTTALKAWLTNLGVKYDNAKALQEFLNNKGFGNRGTQRLDGKWGNRSLEAWNKFVSQTDFTPRVSISPELIEKDRQTIINLVLPKPVLSTIPQEGISNFTPLSTAKTYNRADIRNYIRSKGKGAYDFTGSQRKALRMVMNGQGTDEDKAIVKAMGLFKQGGLISTQNPIQKFKNRNFN